MTSICGGWNATWQSHGTAGNAINCADESGSVRGYPEKLREIETIAFGVDVLVTSSLSEDGYTAALKYITSGRCRFHRFIRRRQIDLDQPNPWEKLAVKGRK